MAEQLRLQQLLRDMGGDFIDNPQELKVILGPILARSQDQQALFYVIFDRWYEEEVLTTVDHKMNPAGIVIAYDEGEDARQLDKYTYSKWLAPLAIGASALLALLILILVIFEPFSKAPDFTMLTHSGIKGSTLTDSTEVGKSVHLFSEFTPQKDEFLILDYGDGQLDTFYKSLSRHGEVHQYKQTGVYVLSLLRQKKSERIFKFISPKRLQSTLSLYISCPGSFRATISKSVQAPKVGEEIEFSFEVEGISASELNYKWDLDGDFFSDKEYPKRSFDKAGNHILNLELTRKNPETHECANRSLVGQAFAVTTPAQEVTLLPMEMKKDDRFEIEHRLSGWGTGLLALVPTLFFLLLGFIIRKLSHKGLSQAKRDKYKSKHNSPIALRFPNRDHLLGPDTALFSLASRLRLRRRSERMKLDILGSIQLTLRKGGMPVLDFNASTKASEYLVLIEQPWPESHLTRLFEVMLSQLKGEDVLLQIYFYDSDPRICWNEDYPEGLSLDILRQRYPDHRLLIYSDGHGLLDPFEPKLQEWVESAFSIWAEKMILISPQVPIDWGYKEKVLHKIFLMLPVALEDQLKIPELLNSSIKVDFDQHQTQLMAASAESLESIKDIDFNSIDGLRKHLSPRLFRWLAATAVYPLPNWEATLVIGNALGEKGGRSPLLHPKNLLKIARIPWMQSGILSPRLRLELLESLDSQTDKLARAAVLELLHDAHFPASSTAARKQAIQEISNKFMLHPGDKEIAREMHYLMEQGMLDGPLSKRMDKPSSFEQDISAAEYLHNRFDAIRPKELIWASILGMLVFFLLGWQIHNRWQREPNLKVKSWTQKLSLENSFLINSSAVLDSAVYFNNASVAAYERLAIKSASDSLKMAQSHRLAQDSSNYLLAFFNYRLIAFNQGVNDYDNGNFDSAIIQFGKVTAPQRGDALLDSLVYEAQHGIGLSEYYKGELEKAWFFANRLSDWDTTYFSSKEPPHLLSLLDRSQSQFEYFREQAFTHFKNKAYPLSIQACDSALLYKAEDKDILKLRAEVVAIFAELEGEGKSSSAFLKTAESLFAQGEYKSAYLYYQMALKETVSNGENTSLIEEKIWIINNCKNGNCDLVNYQNSQFIVTEPVAARANLAIWDKINKYAKSSKVTIVVTRSFLATKKSRELVRTGFGFEAEFRVGKAVFDRKFFLKNRSQKSWNANLLRFIAKLKRDPDINWILTKPNTISFAKRSNTTQAKRYASIWNLCQNDISIIKRKTQILPTPEANKNQQSHISLSFSNGKTTDFAGHKVRAVGAVAAMDRLGNPDRALYFDGNNDFIQVPGLDISVSEDYTVMMWIKPSVSGQMNLFNKMVGLGDADDYGIWIELNERGQPIQTFNWPGNKIMQALSSKEAVKADEWVHLCFVKSGSTLKNYVNGKLTRQYDFQTEIKDKKINNAPILIGKPYIAYHKTYFKGSLNELEFWAKALSTGEIVKQMGQAPSASGISDDPKIQLVPPKKKTYNPYPEKQTKSGGS